MKRSEIGIKNKNKWKKDEMKQSKNYWNSLKIKNYKLKNTDKKK